MQREGHRRAGSCDSANEALLRAKAERKVGITVLICTLNEEENLPLVLPRIPDWVDEVLLVDGHSTDKTVDVARQLWPGIRVLYQPGSGKGDALRYGIQQATGDIIVTLDADGSNDPQEMHRFIEPLLNGYDFAKGSRFLGRRPDMRWHRRLGNQMFALLTNTLYGTRYSDVCCGYNAFWKESCRRVRVTDETFLDEPTMNIRIKKAGLKVAEVSCADKGRMKGVGKDHSLRQGWRILQTIVRERFRG